MSVAVSARVVERSLISKADGRETASIGGWGEGGRGKGPAPDSRPRRIRDLAVHRNGLGGVGGDGLA